MLATLLSLGCFAIFALAQSWKHYPLTLEQNQKLVFPEVEGPQYQYQGDSWFLAAQVQGQITGKKYHVVTIFDRNYITAVILNFYQASIFDYETGDFVTFTEYDLPGLDLANMKYSGNAGSLDIAFSSAAGNATWATKQENDQLVPFVQELKCPGIDHLTQAPFAFNFDINMKKRPVAYGASTLRGFFEFYAQQNTLSYWQPSPYITGNITFNGLTEPVVGQKGHFDRQIFPLYSGIYTPTGRQHSHEWRQINLENGVDLAIWRQFDRTNNNNVMDTTGITTSPVSQKANAPKWFDGLPNDMTIEYISYSKYPRANFSTLVPPPSQNMYLPSEHIIRSSLFKLELHGVYVNPAPVVTLPIEYFEGPMLWNGTINGVSVSGTGIFESTLGLYRDWELVQVLYDSLIHLPKHSFANATSRAKIVADAGQLSSMVSANSLQDNRVVAGLFAQQTVIPDLQQMVYQPAQAAMIEITEDFISSLTLLA